VSWRSLWGCLGGRFGCLLEVILRYLETVSEVDLEFVEVFGCRLGARRGLMRLVIWFGGFLGVSWNIIYIRAQLREAEMKNSKARRKACRNKTYIPT
jgi:hypothetical protein